LKNWLAAVVIPTCVLLFGFGVIWAAFNFPIMLMTDAYHAGKTYESQCLYSP
jgi:hypothetical protein